jgi:hypothetical protein
VSKSKPVGLRIPIRSSTSISPPSTSAIPSQSHMVSSGIKPPQTTLNSHMQRPTTPVEYMKTTITSVANKLSAIGNRIIGSKTPTPEAVSVLKGKQTAASASSVVPKPKSASKTFLAAVKSPQQKKIVTPVKTPAKTLITPPSRVVARKVTQSSSSSSGVKTAVKQSRIPAVTSGSLTTTLTKAKKTTTPLKTVIRATNKSNTPKKIVTPPSSSRSGSISNVIPNQQTPQRRNELDDKFNGLKRLIKSEIDPTYITAKCDNASSNANATPANKALQMTNVSDVIASIKSSRAQRYNLRISASKSQPPAASDLKGKQTAKSTSSVVAKPKLAGKTALAAFKSAQQKKIDTPLKTPPKALNAQPIRIVNGTVSRQVTPSSSISAGKPVATAVKSPQQKKKIDTPVKTPAKTLITPPSRIVARKITPSSSSSSDVKTVVKQSRIPAVASASSTVPKTKKITTSLKTKVRTANKSIKPTKIVPPLSSSRSKTISKYIHKSQISRHQNHIAQNSQSSSLMKELEFDEHGIAIDADIYRRRQRRLKFNLWFICLNIPQYIVNDDLFEKYLFNPNEDFFVKSDKFRQLIADVVQWYRDDRKKQQEEQQDAIQRMNAASESNIIVSTINAADRELEERQVRYNMNEYLRTIWSNYLDEDHEQDLFDQFQNQEKLKKDDSGLSKFQAEEKFNSFR